MSTNLTAQPREKTGTQIARKLRAEGMLPAVVYGTSEKSQPITLVVRDFERMWHEVGESTVITLSGLSKELNVLIQDVAVDPLYGTPTHVDLLAIRTDQKVTVTVPLSFAGVAPAEKSLGGNLMKVMHEMEVEALPKDLPQEIEVNIELLETFEDQIKIGDIVLPQGVIAIADTEEVVALVREAVEVEEEEPETEATDLTDIEVEKKGKEETEATEE